MWQDAKIGDVGIVIPISFEQSNQPCNNTSIHYARIPELLYCPHPPLLLQEDKV